MRKHSKGTSLGVFLLIISLFLYGCTDNKSKTVTAKPSAEQINAEFEANVDILSECFSDISTGSQLFFRENKYIPFTANPKAYVILIKEGITTCDRWENTLNRLAPSGATETLIKITTEYVKNQKLFYKHLLNYADSGKYEDIQLSNKYSRLASENMKAFNPELIKALKNNNYTYELKDGYIHFDRKQQ